MGMRARSNSYGFTLIEVILVLAIGGLIFLLAFTGFQQVTRNRRDAQRRQDVRSVLAYIEEYAANNGGQYPCSNHAFSTGGLGLVREGSGTQISVASQASSGCPGFLSVFGNDSRFVMNGGHLWYNDPQLGVTGTSNNYIYVRNILLANQPLPRMAAYISAKCSGMSIEYLNNNRSGWAVRLALEGGGHVCVDNS